MHLSRCLHLARRFGDHTMSTRTPTHMSVRMLARTSTHGCHTHVPHTTTKLQRASCISATRCRSTDRARRARRVRSTARERRGATPRLGTAQAITVQATAVWAMPIWATAIWSTETSATEARLRGSALHTRTHVHAQTQPLKW